MEIVFPSHTDTFSKGNGILYLYVSIWLLSICIHVYIYQNERERETSGECMERMHSLFTRERLF